MVRGTDKTTQCTCVYRLVDDNSHLFGSARIFGWVSVCGTSHNYGDNDISQFVHLVQVCKYGLVHLSVLSVSLMLMTVFMTPFLYVIYSGVAVVAVCHNLQSHQIKGFLFMVGFRPLRLQPAEFAKFATALAVAKFMSTYGFNIHRWKHFAACAIVVTPMLFIVAQRETGSALVYQRSS